ncbi:hypothetical protein R80B4_00637 [Fibrobacteres bacterium R8-0-B4]
MVKAKYGMLWVLTAALMFWAGGAINTASAAAGDWAKIEDFSCDGTDDEDFAVDGMTPVSLTYGLATWNEAIVKTMAVHGVVVNVEGARTAIAAKCVVTGTVYNTDGTTPIPAGTDGGFRLTGTAGTDKGVFSIGTGSLKWSDVNAGDAYEITVRFTPTNTNLKSITTTANILVIKNVPKVSGNPRQFVTSTGANVDISEVTKWLKGYDGLKNHKATGQPVIPGDKESPVAKSPLSGLGTATFKYKVDNSATSTPDWSDYLDLDGEGVVPPTAVGHYQLWVDIDGESGTNFEGVEDVLLGDYRIVNVQYTGGTTSGNINISAFLDETASVEFSVEGKDEDTPHEVSLPRLKSVSSFGVIDKITSISAEYTKFRGTSLTHAQAIVSPYDEYVQVIPVDVDDDGNADWGETIRFTAEGSGTIKFTLDLLGTTADGFIWEAKGITRFVNVTGRPLSGNVSWEFASGDEFTYNPVYTNTAGTGLLDDFVNNITVSDGNDVLTYGTDFDVVKAYNGKDSLNRTNAGQAWLALVGLTGSDYLTSAASVANVEFTIVPREVSVSLAAPGKSPSKTYDGTASVTVAEIKKMLIFTDEEDGTFLTSAWTNSKVDTLTFTVTDAAYEDANAGTDKTVSATITLLTGPKSLAGNNYRFEEGAVSYKADDGSGKIGIRTLQKADFVYTVPKHWYNGQAQGIGEVTLKEPLKADDVTLLYKFPANSKPYWDETVTKATDTTFPPIAAGTYALTVRVTDANENYKVTDDIAKVTLGNYVISPEAEPTISPISPAAINVRQGLATDIKVTATSPNGLSLQYQWYKTNASGDTATAEYAPGNSSDAVYTVVGTSEGDVLYYKVKVTNYSPGNEVQLPKSKWSSGVVKVTVTAPPIPLSAETAEIRIVDAAKTWTYVGREIELAAKDFKLFIKATETTSEKEVTADHYTVAYSNNVNVGTAAITLSLNQKDYSGTVRGSFAILKKETDQFDFTYTKSETYNYGDSLKGANVKVVGTRSGMGAFTITYAGAAAVPKEAGKYDLIANVAEGTNFTAAPNLFLGIYEVTKRKPDTSSLTYSIPTGHKPGQSTPFGIGEVKVKGTGYGTVTVLYNGSATVPTAAGTYSVTANISGGSNFEAAVVALGSYIISTVSVAEAAREIPTQIVISEAAVAPVKAAAASFTAGPSPVKAGTSIKFFSAKAVKSGSLYIFDASGNSVAKVSAKAGSGEIGSWNLKSKTGAAVSEGTYIVKGALVGKDGTKEKVSFVFSVVK